ncbi:MAG: ABC transporter substrate-binding protein [Mangrovicoccus sp.]|nr:ABC transporter substrate-binding protein [Mangrovicoccus sp.]
MSKTTIAQRLAVTGALPQLRSQSVQPIHIGFLAPLSGKLQSWGQPGLEGCLLWQDRINRAGGLRIRGQRHRVEILARDSAGGPGQTRAATQDLLDQDIKLLLTLGGEDLRAAQDLLHEAGLLCSTLLPSDLSPDMPYLIAPAEPHPIYNVTGVAWMARHRPEIRRMALCSQTDRLGLPSLASYRAACEVEGIAITGEVLYDLDSADPETIVAQMLNGRPDALCWCTSPSPLVHALTQAAYAHGFTGQILSCTADGYDKLLAQTSPEFMEGFLFQFPDFDDPALSETGFFFNQPADFYREYTARFPGQWSAVSWEYPAILDLWHGAVEEADSTDPVSVLAAMKHGRQEHAFGPAQWWGADLFGIDNALVSDWPVVEIRDGKARIAGFEPLLDWLAQHAPVLQRHMGDLEQLWHQRA